MKKSVQYDKLSKVKFKHLADVSEIEVLFDIDDPTSVLAVLKVNDDKTFTRVEVYNSLKEFSTVSMKEIMTLYAKKVTVASDTEFFYRDDPRVHSFLSKLSYPGIVMVCQNLKEFAQQFREGEVKIDIPTVFNRNKNKEQ